MRGDHHDHLRMCVRVCVCVCGGRGGGGVLTPTTTITTYAREDLSHVWFDIWLESAFSWVHSQHTHTHTHTHTYTHKHTHLRILSGCLDGVDDAETGHTIGSSYAFMTNSGAVIRHKRWSKDASA